MNSILLRLSMIWLLLLGGCVGSDYAPDPALTEAGGYGPALVVDGPAELSILPNGSIALRVRYQDPAGGSVAGVQVDFALTGAPQGASLAPTRVITDNSGVATTTLLVGSMPGTLKVRVDTREAKDSAQLTVVVREALDIQLSVSVTYPGQRDIASYTITALDGMDCQRALTAGIAGDVVYRFDSAQREVAFSLAPDLDTALVAWGRDKTGGQLARGCLDYRAPITAEAVDARAELVVPLSDTPMELEQALPVELEIDVLSAAKQLASTAEATVAAEVALPGSTDSQAAAAYYLDAIAKRINKPSAELSGRRAELAQVLSQANVGPTLVGKRIGALVTTRGAAMQLRASYEHGKGATARELRALASDGSKALALEASPSLTMTAAFDEGRAALTLDPLQIALPLGTYGKALLVALDDDDDYLAMQLDEAAGCTENVGPWAEGQGVCDDATAVAACNDALQALRDAVDVAFTGLPTQPIELRGAVKTNDRTEDGVVDDLGPSTLDGTWGTLDVPTDVRAQASTTLAL